MPVRKKKRKRDVERNYPTEQFVAKLRRLANCLEQGRRFGIQVAGERVYIPSAAVINIEHERGEKEEELEFQLKWRVNSLVSTRLARPGRRKAFYDGLTPIRSITS